MERLKDIFKSFMEARLRHAQARLLTELDARTLRDIGYEDRGEMQAQIEAQRLVMFRRGIA